jgi:hypothetical protein
MPLEVEGRMNRCHHGLDGYEMAFDTTCFHSVRSSFTTLKWQHPCGRARPPCPKFVVSQGHPIPPRPVLNLHIPCRTRQERVYAQRTVEGGLAILEPADWVLSLIISHGGQLFSRSRLSILNHRLTGIGSPVDPDDGNVLEEDQISRDLLDRPCCEPYNDHSSFPSHAFQTGHDQTLCVFRSSQFPCLGFH